MKLSLLPKMDGFFEFHPPLNAYVLFCGFFFKFHLATIIMVDQSQAVNSIFFKNPHGGHYIMDAGHVHGPKLSLKALTLHFAMVVNGVRTRVLLQSFPLSQRPLSCFFFPSIVMLCTHNLPCC